MGDIGRVYLDASVIIRRTFQQAGALADIPFQSAISSELVVVEVERTLDNRRLMERSPEDEFLRLRQTVQDNMAKIQFIPLDQIVLRRAMSAFPARVGTLDAIHLATALLWADYMDDTLVFLTHDRQLGTAARRCGLRVYPEPV